MRSTAGNARRFFRKIGVPQRVTDVEHKTNSA